MEEGPSVAVTARTFTREFLKLCERFSQLNSLCFDWVRGSEYPLTSLRRIYAFAGMYV